MKTHQPEQAATMLESAVLNNSKNAQAHLMLAVCYFNLQKFSKARTAALAAADIDKSKAATGRMIAAKAYLMENDLKHAREGLQTFKNDFPADKGIGEAKELLEKIEKVETAIAVAE